MKSTKLWSAGGCLTALVVLVVGAVACGDSDANPSPASTPPAPSDGGVDPVADASASADAPTAPAASVLLKPGEAGPIGVTPGGLVVYYAADRSVEAVPITGGEPVKVAPPEASEVAPVVFSNGAVAWWTNVDPNGLVGTLNVWNETDGAKIVSTTSTFRRPNPAKTIFAASPDGRRVAFSTAATAQTTNLHVADVATATAAAAGMLQDADLVRRDGFCADKLDMRFVGKRLIATFCASNGVRAYVVPEGSTTAVRFDDDNNIRMPLTWSVDDLGNKVFYSDAIGGGRFVDLTDLAAITGASVDGSEGFILKDGSAVIYRKETEIRRWSTPKPGVPNDVGSILATNVGLLGSPTKDRSRAWISEGASRRTIDTSRPMPAKLISKDASAVLLGFTGSDRYAVYTTGPSNDLTLTARRSVGGTALPIARGLMTEVVRMVVPLALEGDALVVAVSPDPPPQPGDFIAFLHATHELRYMDLERGTSVSLGTGLGPVALFAGKKVIYVRAKDPGMGLYLYDPK